MEKTYTYELTKDGYYIYINGQKVIHQYEPYIPDKSKSYEENAKAQIAEMQEADSQEIQEKTEIEELRKEVESLKAMLNQNNA